ncbi:amino acid racemase [Bradyrhizobium sp. NP1]|uniref:aspartate/glutamate racemase family protein n=1 Tax=Bradyrhizobium sp. NP1 TaxID=3049772 RepID=UPI0025A56DD4|nr:amino acid racemase [Bradyrhizobium sp. NP1]WJR80963.1 amino acid racemase [Bradyrhizobium sp. NP1]
MSWTRATPAVRRQRRRLGLIGGMSWRSTALYHERLNRAAERAFGSHGTIVGQIDSLDYAELLSLASRGDMAAIEAHLVDAATRLRRAGCEVIALTAVTAHRWHKAVAAAVDVPVPHVLAAVARTLRATGTGDIGVLGTALTCRSDAVRSHLGEGRRLLFPDDGDQPRIDDLIQRILTVRDAGAEGRDTLAAVSRTLQGRGARAIVLACTELPLLLPVPAVDLPVIDAVALHVDDIFDRICE